MPDIQTADSFGRAFALTDEQAAAADRAGLTEHEARRRFRRRTLLECGVYLLCWAALITLLLPAERRTLRWAGLPHRTTTVIENPDEPGSLLLRWTDPEGRFHDFLPGSVPYVPGRQVEVVDPQGASPYWDTPADVRKRVAKMVVVVGGLPLAGLAVLLGHRARRWRRVRAAGSGTPRAMSVWLRRTRWRTFAMVRDPLGRIYHVPLMRNQRVETLDPAGLLIPLAVPEPRAQVAFRVAGTDRVVWPAGGCHTSVWPVGGMAVTVVRTLVPILLWPVAYWVTKAAPLA